MKAMVIILMMLMLAVPIFAAAENFTLTFPITGTVTHVNTTYASESQVTTDNIVKFLGVAVVVGIAGAVIYTIYQKVK